MRTSLPISLLLLGCAGCSGESEPAEARPFSAVLITLDTTRYDALTTNGAPIGITPHMDRIATEGVLYEQAYAVAPLTLPSHLSMLTGLYPPRHGVRTNGAGRLPDSALTLAEAAREAGLQTAAFLGAAVLDDVFGADQGFDRYDSPAPDVVAEGTHYDERRGSEVVAAATEWLASRDRERRFFLWVHVWDPHAPLDPPPQFISRAPTYPYLSEVAAADAAVGQLVEALAKEGVLDETMVLIVADHGEAFGEHGELSHGSYCYQATLRVPMILRYPDGTDAHRRSSEVVSVADVHPTLAEAMGFAPAAGIDGRSLFRRQVAADRGVYFESYYGYLNYAWSPLAGWLDADGKYLHSSEPELFDLRSDPDEKDNLAATRAAELGRYRAAIQAVLDRPALAQGAGDSVAGEMREALQGLGYAMVAQPEGGLPSPLADTDLPSPTSRIDENRNIIVALDHVNKGRFAEAEAMYDEILAGNPDNYEALERIGFCRMRQDRYGEAITPLETLLKSGRASANAIANLALCHRAMGKNDEALQLYQVALTTDPNEVRALAQLIDLLRVLDRADEVGPYQERLDRLTEDG